MFIVISNKLLALAGLLFISFFLVILGAQPSEYGSAELLLEP